MAKDDQKESKLRNVYQAITAVQAGLSKHGISKDKTATGGGGATFKFRGIDDIYNVLSSLLAENGLCIMPRVLSREITERKSSKGNALFYVVVDVEYDFVSADDSSKHTVRVCGEAMDSGDKASNKALSAAYKYACLQTFCIPTEGDNDSDATSHEVAAKSLSIFESYELREKFTDNCVASIGNCMTGEELRTIKELDLARWQAMKTSQDGGDVDAYNRILAAYNPKFAELKAQAAKSQPKTVDSVVQRAGIAHDTISY